MKSNGCAHVCGYLSSLSLTIISASRICILPRTPRAAESAIIMCCTAGCGSVTRLTIPSSAQPAEVQARKAQRDRSYSHAAAAPVSLSFLSACASFAFEQPRD